MKYIISLCLLLFIGSNLQAQSCTVNGPVVITSQGTTEIQFEVSGLANADLSDPLQSLCLVELSFAHNTVSTLEIEIESPAGQILTLVGPGNVNSLGSTQFIQWDVVFAADNYPPLPDAGFADRWDNANAWEAFNNYNGRYYPPTGALGDLDMGSANGIWTIRMEDLSQFGSGVLNRAAIQFCDVTGAACDVCYANAGYFDDVESNVFCTNDPVLSDANYFDVLSEGGSFSNESYNYAVVENDSILSFTGNIGLNTLPPGDYLLCGVISDIGNVSNLLDFEYLSDLETAFEDGTYCGAITEKCIDIRIEEPPTSETKTEFLCPDEVITVDGLNFYQAIDTTVYTYSLAGCESSTRYIVNEVELEAEIIASNNTIPCNGTLLLNGLGSIGTVEDYIWTTESGNLVNSNSPIVTIDAPGLYFLEVVNANCSSITSFEVKPDASFTNTVVLQADSLGCVNSAVTIDAIIGGTYDSFTWEGPGITDPTELFPTVSVPGVYTITIENAGSDCPTVSNSIVIAQSNTAPTALFNNIAPIDCNSVTQIQVVNNIDAVEAAWLNSSGDTIGSNPLAVNITNPDIYTYNYIDAFGCAGSSSIEVEANFEPLTVEIAVDSLSCNKLEGQIFAEIDGSYNNIFWIGPVSFFKTIPNPEVEYPGSYFLEVYSEDGCVTRDTVEIEYDQEAFNMNLTSQTITCSSRETDIVVVPGGPAYDYEWSRLNDAMFTAPNADQITVDVGGFHFVDITRQSDDCTIRELKKVIVDTVPAAIIFDQEKLDCDSPEIALESNLASFGISDFTWSGDNLDPADANNPEPIVNEIGEYYLEGISGNGCAFMDTVVVEQDLVAPVLTPQNTFILDCFDDDASTLVVADQVVDFIISTPSGVMLDTIINDRVPLDIDEAGSYIVDIVASNGCQDQLVIDVEYGQEPPAVDIIGAADLDCDDPEVTVEAILGGDWDTFEWMHNGNTSDNMITITEAGEYIIDVMNNAGCSVQDTINIEDNRRPVDFSLVADTITCTSPMANIAVDAMENLTYEWAGPDGDLGTDPSIDVLEAETYYLTVTANDGCIAIDSVAIVIDTMRMEFDLLPIALIDCIDDVATAEVDLSSVDENEVAEVNWILDGVIESTGLSGSLTKGGMYTVELIGSNGCVSEEMVEVLEDKVFPLVTLEPDSINCLESTFEVTAQVIANDPTYEWDGPDAAITGSSSDMISGEEPGIYTVTVTDDNNCSVVETVVIEGDFDQATTFAEDLVLTCADPNATIILNDYDASIHEVSIIDSDGNAFADAFDDVTVPGEYTLEVTGENGCVAESSFMVLGDLDAPAATLDSTNINCVNTDGMLAVLSPENIQSYEWITGDLDPQFVGDEAAVTTLGPGLFEVVITGFNGCSDTLSSNIEIDTVAPLIVLDQIGIIGCASTESTLSSVNSTGQELVYSWSTNDGVILSGGEEAEVLVEGVGTYTLDLVSDANGCVNTEAITVIDEGNVLTITELNAMAPPCEGENLGQINIGDITGSTGPLEYSIDGGVTFEDSGFFDNLAAGDYDVLVVDSIGCEVADLAIVDDGVMISLDLGQDTTIRIGESYTILPESNYDPADVTAIWETNYPDYDCFDCWENEVTPLNTTVYTVTITDDFNCTITDEIVIEVDQTTPVYIANIVDFQAPVEEALVKFNAGPGVEMVESWIILDRWGNIMHREEDFVPNDILTAWDGTSNGVKVLPGVYLYVADIVLINGNRRTIAGDITVIR